MPLTKLPDVQVRSSSLAPHSLTHALAATYAYVKHRPRHANDRHATLAAQRDDVASSEVASATTRQREKWNRQKPTRTDTHSSHARTRARDDGRRTLARTANTRGVSIRDREISRDRAGRPGGWRWSDLTRKTTGPGGRSPRPPRAPSCPT